MVSRKKRLEIQKENEKAQKLLKKQRQELHKPLLGLTASRGFVKPKEIESAKFLVRNNFSTPL